MGTRVEEAKGLKADIAQEHSAILQAARRRLIGAEPDSSWVTLDAYVQEIQNGRSPQCEGQPAEEGEWGVLKVGAVSFGKYNHKENKALPRAILPNPDFEVVEGDFLMIRSNTSELVGACTIVEETPPRLMLSDKHFRFRFHVEAPLSPQYLDHVLKSPALRSQIMQAATGTSPTMKNISKAKVLKLLMPSHSLEEQKFIAAELDELQALTAEARISHKQSTDELSAVLPSVLNQIFNGGVNGG